MIVAGNSVNDKADDTSMRLIDELLAQLASSVCTEVMPGPGDPSNLILPQQPMHPCLFPKSASYSKSFKTVCNPYAFDDPNNGLTFLGSSGQNVDDVIRNSNIDDPLDTAEKLIRWKHVAPTCPDTLGCFPYRNEDPFVLNKRPHLLFVGNQKKFDQRFVSCSTINVTVNTLQYINNYF